MEVATSSTVMRKIDNQCMTLVNMQWTINKCLEFSLFSCLMEQIILVSTAIVKLDSQCMTLVLMFTYSNSHLVPTPSDLQEALQ